MINLWQEREAAVLRESSTKNGPRLRPALAGWLTVCFLLLMGALVFFWGTEYKLSLYKADPTMQTPAKLCTRSSESARSEMHLAIRPSEAATPLLDAIAIGSYTASKSPAVIPTTIPLDISLPSYSKDLPQVAFRPPPASVRVTT
jgi:hypothetical protein